MQTEKHVRLYRNGRNQAVRIPRDFEMDGNEAIIRKEGNKLIIEPVDIKKRLLELLKTLEPINEEFPEIEDPIVKDEELF
jgi:antitoxin VapB